MTTLYVNVYTGVPKHMKLYRQNYGSICIALCYIEGIVRSGAVFRYFVTNMYILSKFYDEDELPIHSSGTGLSKTL